jgi:hypothetical protein
VLSFYYLHVVTVVVVVVVVIAVVAAVVVTHCKRRARFDLISSNILQRHQMQ